jgi:hypothetical protein
LATSIRSPSAASYTALTVSEDRPLDLSDPEHAARGANS